MHSRRAIIAFWITLLSAGCTSVDFPDRRNDNTWCKQEAIAGPFDPAEEVPPKYSSTQRVLAQQAIQQDAATAYYGPRPLKNDSYVVMDGAYYKVVLRDSYTEDLPALVLTVEWEPSQKAPANAAVTSFTDLPESDRLALQSAVYGGVYRSQTHPETVLVHSESPVLYPDGTQESLLASREPGWVTWDDRIYHITVHREETVQTSVYEYTASLTAANAKRFRELIASQYLVHLDGLTPEERTILEEAIDDRYYERTESQLPPFERLWDRLGQNTVPESGGRYFVEYEGERYGLELSRACQGV